MNALFLDDADILAGARRLLDACQARGAMLVTAESCTGGLIAAALTEIPGASAVVERGFVTYSNAAKIAQLGVPDTLIRTHGAVSAEVAKSMAEGALARVRRETPDVALALSVTGVAGPGGGTETKPEGLVHFAAATPDGVLHTEVRFGPIGRGLVRRASTARSLALGLKALATSA